MAKPTIELIEALRETATRLRNGAYYSWGNHGACNCGNLVQVVTKFSKGEILRYAHTGIGEWTEMAEEFCPVTNAPLSLVITRLEDIGLTPTDIHNVEYLADKEVLHHLKGGFRWLKRNRREDATAYFEAFAELLEDKLIQAIDLSDLPVKEKPSPVSVQYNKYLSLSST
ncbi:MAG: hypothetical protein H7Z13_01415 [Ferruginibacter sp.]|nr:hypothetical protein [Ferruginibacter sp.]